MAYRKQSVSKYKLVQYSILAQLRFDPKSYDKWNWHSLRKHREGWISELVREIAYGQEYRFTYQLVVYEVAEKTLL